ncbi:hypothetical protein ONE63_002509 [Megalurothrips usitatus]|uniref:GATA-binding factor C-like n=1 Tax=Megalurothrips usitatus TaxID=439358 RepID=A0AAV7XF34_9NEOP|nr:hypothetical protein ONE63_002509 [Megalurothrips usitatus]
MTMKKEGIQTRNRKLSSKSKKKKGGGGGCLSLSGVMSEMMKPLDPSGKGVGGYPGSFNTNPHHHLGTALHPAAHHAAAAMSHWYHGSNVHHHQSFVAPAPAPHGGLGGGHPHPGAPSMHHHHHMSPLSALGSGSLGLAATSNSMASWRSEYT